MRQNICSCLTSRNKTDAEEGLAGRRGAILAAFYIFLQQGISPNKEKKSGINPRTSGPRGGAERQAGRQARSYFGGFLHFFTTRNKSQKIRNKTDAEEGQAGRRADRQGAILAAFYYFSMASSPLHSLTNSSLRAGTRVSWGKDSSEGNISPPFAQILFLTLSEMKLRMSTVGSTLKNTMHKLFLDLKSLMQNFTRNWKVTLMKLTPVDLNI